MKKIFILLFISSLFLSGCDSYLDRQPDDALTSDTIWEKQKTTLQYLWNVYSYMRDDTSLMGGGDHSVDSYCSDEAGGSFPNWFYGEYIFETYNTGSVPGAFYSNQYNGIHEASIFMENVDRCPELSDAEKRKFKAEARFMRAYYYFYLMKNYGPVFWNGYDSQTSINADIYTTDRATWQTLVDFVCSELDLAAADLPESWETTRELGRATKGAAKAIKARLLLYSARPLFNGQNGTGMYDNIINLHGEKLFNTTYDVERWKMAADAAKEVIDMSMYSLVNDSANPDPVKRGLENLTKLYVTDHAPKEYIWTYSADAYKWRYCIQPQYIIQNNEGWASLSPTQKLVDAFAMADGVYPVTPEHWGTEAYAHGKNVEVGNAAHVDPRAVSAGYNESEGVNMKNPLLEIAAPKNESIPVVEKPTMKQFAGREARFYRNVGWSGMQYILGDAVMTTQGSEIEFYTGGKNAQPSCNNVPPFGYLALKFYDPTLNPLTSGHGNMTWPIVRLGGVYLDYAEALNECDGDINEILTYWNMVRNRAGVPNIEEVYPDVTGNKELRRNLIRRERMIELCFENHRWVDIRTWMIAEETNNGYLIGLNSKAGTDAVGSAYWTRCEIGMEEYAYGEGKKLGPRKFTKKSYLFPFPTSEVNKVPALRNSQNLGW